MTTTERRGVVETVRRRYDASERRACRVLGFERTAMRYVPTRPAKDAPLRARLRELAAAYPRWGVPRLHWRLQRDGLPVNYKRVERVYRLEGLAVRTRHRKRLAVPRVPRPPVLAPNETWAIDFVSDALASGRRFRAFTVVDVCTHECLAIRAAHSLPSVAVIDVLAALVQDRGAPTRLSLDNGSEFRSRAFDAWANDAGIELAFIQPGKPIQNAHIESFNGRLRDECLSSHWFLSLADARFHLERFRHLYNTERPTQPCWPLTPAEYAATFSSPARLSA
jgi:putative transposase